MGRGRRQKNLRLLLLTIETLIGTLHFELLSGNIQLLYLVKSHWRNCGSKQMTLYFTEVLRKMAIVRKVDSINNLKHFLDNTFKDQLLNAVTLLI